MEIRYHLYQEKLSEEAEKEIDRIIARLLRWDEWEERDDGIAEAAKKENIAAFENNIAEIKKACEVTISILLSR